MASEKANYRQARLRSLQVENILSRLYEQLEQIQAETTVAVNEVRTQSNQLVSSGIILVFPIDRIQMTKYHYHTMMENNCYIHCYFYFTVVNISQICHEIVNGLLWQSG